MKVFGVLRFGSIREFPNIRGTFFGGPYNKDPTNWATILGSPIFENYEIITYTIGFLGLC